MRIEPKHKYHNLPCSYVGTGCAYEDITKKEFTNALPKDLRTDGYLTLDGANKYLRSIFKVRKKIYYKRTERITLGEFLLKNKERCCVLVLGHFIYVNGENYWSFFDNENDMVVCIWYLEDKF